MKIRPDVLSYSVHTQINRRTDKHANHYGSVNSTPQKLMADVRKVPVQRE